MTAVNLNALGNLQSLNQPVQTHETKDSSAKGDFEKVMKTKVSSTSTQDRLKTEDAVKQPVKRTEVKNDGMSKAKSMTKQKETKALPKEEADATDIQETAEAVMAGAAQILNVTPEELKAAMESLELDVGDLTDRNNVAQLILFLNGSDDISDMLVDNGMLEAFNELNGMVEEILDSHDIKPEDFKTLIENIGMEQVAEEPSLETVDVKPETGNVKGNLETDYDQDANEGVVQQTAGEPQVIVEDNRDASENQTSTESEKNLEKPETAPKEEQVATGLENFVRNLELAVNETGEVTETQTDVREIVYQVVQRIRVQLNPDSSSLEMRLNPENLGRVSINITSKAGVMTAEINTENRQAREAIESSLQILKENIEAKGIKVEAVEVRVSDFNMQDSRNSESSGEDGRPDGGRNRRSQGLSGLGGIDDIASDESDEVILDPASTVSYRA